MKRVHLNASAVLAAAILIVGCSSANPRPTTDVLNEEAPDWVYDPSADWDADDEPFVYYATGMGRIGMNLNLAEAEAHSDAMSDIQAFLETTIERLGEYYAQEAGDLLDEDTKSSFVNNELFTRELVSGTVSGARIAGKWWDQDYIYVRLKFDAEDQFLGAYQQSLAARLRQKTRELTQKDKESMRSELERLVTERNEMLEEG